jgi:hypothetical protein
MSAYAEDLTQGTDWQKFIGDKGKINAFKVSEAAKQIALKNGLLIILKVSEIIWELI